VIGMSCSLQNVRYELVADVYVFAVELSIAIPRRMDHLWIGFNMGTGKPMVFPKKVTWVWVRYWILAHRSTPRTRTTVSQVYAG
jgi:hypothetical protein